MCLLAASCYLAWVRTVNVAKRVDTVWPPMQDARISDVLGSQSRKLCNLQWHSTLRKSLISLELTSRTVKRVTERREKIDEIWA